MGTTRRDFVRAVTGAVLTAGTYSSGVSPAAEANDAGALPIVDTHQHLWDLSRFQLAWLDGAPDVLRKSYTTKEYREATEGLNVVKAVYMEVDVVSRQHVAEAEDIVALCRSGAAPTVAAVIGGRPASPDFADYVARFRNTQSVKGVRQVLQGSETKPGYCLQPEFVRGIRRLGDVGMCFDLCMSPGELPDGHKLASLCPETRFVLDHCGNADPKAFRKGSANGDKPPGHDPNAWKRDVAKLAELSNVICKISGIVASAPKDWTPSDLAPIVNHCFDSFGPDRVIFGGDWPVCLLGAPYRRWVEALRTIVSERRLEDRRKLWSENAEQFFGLR